MASLSAGTRNALDAAVCDTVASGELARKINHSTVPALTPLVITYTTGAPAYVAHGTLTIANGGTPTVSELLDYCIELQAQIAALKAALV